MTLQEAKEKYLDKILRNPNKPFLFHVWRVKQIGEHRTLEFELRQTLMAENPNPQITFVSLKEIQSEFRLID